LSRTPHAHRLGARYHYRRRIHLTKIISSHVRLSLRTADPGEARARSALLSARFAIVMETVRGMLNQDRDFLTGKEIHALIRAELERELARAIAPSYDDDTHAPYMAKISRIVAAAYDIARRPERPTKLTEEDAQFLLAKGFDEIEFDFIEQDLADRCYSDELADDDVRRRLEAVGAPTNAVSIQRARPILMRARWEAHARAMRMDDPRVRNALGRWLFARGIVGQPAARS